MLGNGGFKHKLRQRYVRFDAAPSLCHPRARQSNINVLRVKQEALVSFRIFLSVNQKQF